MSETNGSDHLSVLIVDEDPGRSAILEQALSDGGCTVIAKLNSGEHLVNQVEQYQPDVIIIDLDSPDRDTLENMYHINQSQPRPIVMFVEDDDGDSVDRVIAAGVSAYVVDGLSPKRVRPIVDLAVARFREYQALRDELARTKDSLEERKLIERAKGMLMESQEMSEKEAHQALRKLAMDQGKKLGEAARSVIAVMELIN